MRIHRVLCLSFVLVVSIMARAQEISAPEPQAGTIVGSVEDTSGATIPAATVTLAGTGMSEQSATADQAGFFVLNNAPSAVPLHITIHAKGFADWTSPAITLTPGQHFELTNIQLRLADVETTVNAIMPEELALQQVHAEEEQRILGVIPNFYVVYDKNPMPMTTKLKYQLALKAGTDVVTIGGAAFLAGIYQASGTPNYQQGLKGYGQRFGAAFTDGFTDIMIGGAILPSLLHQDPRYFYQGEGSKTSRFRHAVLAPFLCKGDNGKTQFNFSSIGGDLGAGALSNLYYPASNRGTGLVFDSALITTGGRIANALAQEFLLHRITSKTKNQN
jgi:Carboxypeptidase regulatory-like domain